ncbi:MAG TPA: VWA domain-containing protein [Candidatus Binatia bacterium]|nr:VWA domain-containing protein [Candidatus Binatia bacterium]
MSARRSWLARPDPALAAAERRAAALGPSAHASILGACDRLAGVSTLLAVRAYEQSPAAWSAFGSDDYARWINLAAGLATTSREAALGLVSVPPADFGPGGVQTAAAWCGLGREVASTSRRLAAAYFARTASVVARDDGLARLRAWAAAGLRLYESRGWRGAFLAQAYFDAAPAALEVLGPAEYDAWADLGATFAGDVDEREFFAALPAGLADWSAGERDGFLRALARTAPRPARAVYRELPGALRALDPAVRAAVLGLVATLDARVAPALADLAGVLGAIVAEIPAGARLELLGLVGALAERAPDAALAALRVAPRLYEEAAPDQVRQWFAAGVAIADENEVAGRAYFALASRTSVKVLRAASTAATLEETEGLWRKLVQMLSGEGATIRGFEGVTLRPPLEAVPEEREVALPSRVDRLSTHEENCRVYRFLAAQLAGRREFGTYASAEVRVRLASSDDDGLLDELFRLAEGVRIAQRVAATYPGLAPEAAAIGSRLLAGWSREDRPTRGVIVDALLALTLGAEGRPPWLPGEAVQLVRRAVGPLAAPDATAEDALRVATELAAIFAAPALRLPAAELTGELMLDDLTGGEPLDPWGEAESAAGGVDAEPAERLDGVRIELAPEEGRPAGGQPLTAEELRRLIEAGAKIGQGTGDVGAGGIPVTELAGKLPRARLDELRRLLADAPPAAPPGTARSERDERAFFYDEWDHLIGDYRPRWCRLYERHVDGDSGEFFARSLTDHAALLPEVRRQFQRIRPEMYRPIRGLEDGEDFDLNAVTDARADVRARRPASTRLYRARVREARDVATLFLLDMSASTDEPLGPRRRIIDALKDALVVMTEALEELGDAYAIYGFSGQGRDNVEFYLVKGFGEALGPGVKARIGGILPKRSTRMGTALRHASRKLGAVGARAKHLMLLSDGFPQDDDYGEDRRSHVYGIRDTAVALREADATGITPFCITVDRAGHDYLREMCDPSRYMVIDDITALPRELPKIYRRVVRA